MPIYEYECTACQHQFEAIQKSTARPLKTCPKCQQTSLKKLISATNFQLKGSGWYATDFKNSKPANEVKTETKAETQATETKNTDSSS